MPLERWERLPLVVRAGAVLAAGMLSALGFAPSASPIPPLIGFALLHLVLAADRPRLAWAWGFLFAWGHFSYGFSWIARAFTYQAEMPVWMGWVAVFGLSAFLSLVWAAAARLARALAGRSLVLMAPALAGTITLAELVRGSLFTGFPWNPPGVVWLPWPGVAAGAGLVGATGLTALLVLASGSLALLLAGGTPGVLRRLPQRGFAFGVLLVPPALVAAGLVWGLVRPALPAATGPLLLLVQANLTQEEKHAPGGIEEGIARHIALTERALARSPGAQAVIWPEAAVELLIEEDPWLRRKLTLALAPGQLLLTGGIAIERDPFDRELGARNSLFALDAQGHILARYDKTRLVPGGEYLPLRSLAEPLGLTRVVPGALDFWPGRGPTSLDLPGLGRVGANICYEIIFSGRVIERGRRPDWLVTVSNDAWFGRAGPPQHHAQARLRAIEEGLPIARVTPTGITSLIDRRGNVVASLPQHQPGVLVARLGGAARFTPFALAGQWIPLVLGLALIAAAARVGRQGRTEKLRS